MSGYTSSTCLSCHTVSLIYSVDKFWQMFLELWNLRKKEMLPIIKAKITQGEFCQLVIELRWCSLHFHKPLTTYHFQTTSNFIDITDNPRKKKMTWLNALYGLDRVEWKPRKRLIANTLFRGSGWCFSRFTMTRSSAVLQAFPQHWPHSGAHRQGREEREALNRKTTAIKCYQNTEGNIRSIPSALSSAQIDWNVKSAPNVFKVAKFVFGGLLH